MFAQEKAFVFSLEEAQSYALEHNKTIMNARSDIQLADVQLKESISAGLPQISGTVDYLTNFNYEFVFDLGGEVHRWNLRSITQIWIQGIMK